jgi:hypothetical protein
MLTKISRTSLRFPEAMRAYVSLLTAVQTLYSKFSTMTDELDKTLMFAADTFIACSGAEMTRQTDVTQQRDRDLFEARLTVHLGAVCAIRDVVLTYSQLDSSKNNSNWQSAEFHTTAKMIQFASLISVRGIMNQWEPRVEGLLSIRGIFSHFSIATAKRRQGNVVEGKETMFKHFQMIGQETFGFESVRADAWFPNLEKAVIQAFKLTLNERTGQNDESPHENQATFRMALTRLKSFIEARPNMHASF